MILILFFCPTIIFYEIIVRFYEESLYLASCTVHVGAWVTFLQNGFRHAVLKIITLNNIGHFSYKLLKTPKYHALK